MRGFHSEISINVSLFDTGEPLRFHLCRDAKRSVNFALRKRNVITVAGLSPSELYETEMQILQLHHVFEGLYKERHKFIAFTRVFANKDNNVPSLTSEYSCLHVSPNAFFVPKREV